MGGAASSFNDSNDIFAKFYHSYSTRTKQSSDTTVDATPARVIPYPLGQVVDWLEN